MFICLLRPPSLVLRPPCSTLVVSLSTRAQINILGVCYLGKRLRFSLTVHACPHAGCPLSRATYALRTAVQISRCSGFLKSLHARLDDPHRLCLCHLHLSNRVSLSTCSTVHVGDNLAATYSWLRSTSNDAKRNAPLRTSSPSLNAFFGFTSQHPWATALLASCQRCKSPPV
jgi:hypothetical protein